MLRGKDVGWMIFESHAHYDDKQFDFDRDEFFDGKYKMSVSFFLNSGQYATMVLKQLMMRLEQEYEKVKLR